MVYKITKEDVDADSWFGFETRAELASSIIKLEKKRKTSRGNPLEYRKQPISNEK